MMTVKGIGQRRRSPKVGDNLLNTRKESRKHILISNTDGVSEITTCYSVKLSVEN